MSGKVLTGQDALLQWCKRVTKGYSNVNVENFTTSWKDGLAFAAIVHAYHPEAIKFDELDPQDHATNLQTSFDAAEKFGIVPLLEPEDIVSMPKPDKLSIITYVSQFYHAFNKQALKSVRFDEEAVAASVERPKQAAKASPVSNTSKPAATSSTSAAPPSSSEPPGNCSACGKVLEGQSAKINGAEYHVSCFRCSTCNRELKSQLEKKECLVIGGKPYCEQCGRSAFSSSRKIGSSGNMLASPSNTKKATDSSSEKPTESSPKVKHVVSTGEKSGSKWEEIQKKN